MKLPPLSNIGVWMEKRSSYGVEDIRLVVFMPIDD
jgi:hypothetical protein